MQISESWDVVCPADSQACCRAADGPASRTTLTHGIVHVCVRVCCVCECMCHIVKLLQPTGVTDLAGGTKNSINHIFCPTPSITWAKVGKSVSPMQKKCLDQFKDCKRVKEKNVMLNLLHMHPLSAQKVRGNVLNELNFFHLWLWSALAVTGSCWTIYFLFQLHHK